MCILVYTYFIHRTCRIFIKQLYDIIHNINISYILTIYTHVNSYLHIFAFIEVGQLCPSSRVGEVRVQVRQVRGGVPRKIEGDYRVET